MITQKQVDTVMDMLAKGEHLLDALKRAEISRPSAWYNHLASDPALSEMYTRVREANWQVIGDQFLALADDTSIEPNSRRIMVDARKWLLSKVLPKQYGERLTVDSTVKHTADDMSNDELAAIAAQARKKQQAG
jgi:hypothetical protein